MDKIENFDKFNLINEEASPRMPKSEDYWLKKGKSGKDVALYTHDDMDGMFCAIEMKKYLLNAGFNIVKYGILNYSEGWKYTELDPKLINIVLDFADMPGDERDDLIDYYLDHHGLFSAEELEKYKSSPVQKKKTASAYEAICQSLGVSQDELTLSVIDMIDAAKYDDYDVPWQRLLDFNLSDIKRQENKRLEFAAAFNQFIKRSDTKTIVAVINHCNDASIYSIFNAMKKLYPEHNINLRGPKAGIKKDFIEDSTWRLGEMQKKTRGTNHYKKEFTNQADFVNAFRSGSGIKVNGYQIIGDLVFVPTGTWANALRARTIVEKDFMDGKINQEPKFIMLQYGSTIQVCSFKKMDKTEGLPVLQNGEVIEDLGKYMVGLLDNFKKHLDYDSSNTAIGQDEVTVSGGHGGIGTISNIIGTCKKGQYAGQRYVDMFKNKIITDLSGVRFNLSLKWSEPAEWSSGEPAMNNKVINMKDVTKLDNVGNVKENLEYNIIDKETGEPVVVSKDDFLRAGLNRKMKSDSMTIDSDNKRIIAKFEDFKYKG